MCFILLVIWTIYTYRDIWPLATYTLVPVDASEGWILWVKISSLTLAGVMEPLIAPRRYIPVGREVRGLSPCHNRSLTNI